MSDFVESLKKGQSLSFKESKKVSTPSSVILFPPIRNDSKVELYFKLNEEL